MIYNPMNSMLRLLTCILTSFILVTPLMSQETATTAGDVTFTAKGVIPEPPLFFTTEATAKTTVSANQISQEISLTLHVLQGRPELMTLELLGSGEVKSVTGASLVDWGVRRSADGKKRFLDIKAVYHAGQPKRRDLEMLVKTTHAIEFLPANVQLLTVNPGESAGFSSRLDLQIRGVDARLAAVKGVLPLEKDWSFSAHGSHTLSLKLYPTGALPDDVELRGARVVGVVDEKLGSARFSLQAMAHVSGEQGGVLDFLSGAAAISQPQEGADYRLRLVKALTGKHAGRMHYQMQFDRAGVFPVQLQIIANISDQHPSWKGWNTIDFFAPQGAVVPVEFSGLNSGVLFGETQPVLLRKVQAGWRGFLPASGHCLIVWKKGRKAGDGKLAFTSNGLTDVSMGAGLMRQTSDIQLKILQGKLNQLSLRMHGPGEILAVEGTHIAGWSVVEDPAGKGQRLLNVRLSLPLEHTGTIKVRSQQALGQFPVTASPLRLTPVGVLRHSGYVRLSNAGAVRLETAGVKGMMQLSPDQYPGTVTKARQLFVFRYPSEDYSWEVNADQILPEVSLNQILVYQQTESDRVIHASAELDIREAPLREWELRVPEGYAVSSLTGAEVADYVVGTAVSEGLRDIKVLFKKAVSGRQLIELRLEKNAPAVAGEWKLPVLEYPGAKSVRGHLGVAASAGWRVLAGEVSKLTETPLSYFPVKNADLQQTYRLRETGWSASVKIEAREQSVQADVFHLYSLKEGMTYGSVLLNYFVVGAPVTQWELAIPEAYGNVMIEGQNVRLWRRIDAERVVVQLEQPISGAATLLVTYDNSMSARGGRLVLGEVRPINVQSESGFIEVVSPVLLKHKVAKSSAGLLKVSAQELPAEFRMLTIAPSQAAWQYAARPFELEIETTWFAPGKTLEQVVDFANLESSVSRDGQIKTEAVFFVRTRGRQALRMTLPTGSKLWDARANGETITARLDGQEYLLPLPVGEDPNKPVEVRVRYGGRSEKGGSKVALGAPTLSAPVMIAGWSLRGEKGRMLVPVGQQQGVRTPPMTQTGFESLQGREWIVGFLGFLLLGGVYFLRRSSQGLRNRVLAVVWLLILLGCSLMMAQELWQERRVNRSVLEVTAQVVSPDAPLHVVVHNVAPWKAMVSVLGIIATAVGALTLLAGLFVEVCQRFWVRALAVAALIAGVLAQAAGGTVFFALLGAVAAVLLCVAIFRMIDQLSSWNRQRKQELEERRHEAVEAVSLGSPEGAIDGVVKLLVVAAGVSAMLFGPTGTVQAKTSSAGMDVQSVDAMHQTWNIQKDRLSAKVNLSIRGEAGTSHLLLREPAVLTSFVGNGLSVRKIKRGSKNVWMLVVEKSGPLTATATYEMAMPANRANFTLPTGPASVQKITAMIDEPGLELYSTAAVQTLRHRPGGEGNIPKGGVELVLAPQTSIVIGVRARGRDISAEETKFYSEVANLYLPSPGVVDGVHRVTIRPSSGKVDHLEMTVPAGFTVGEVQGNAVGNWRFDPATRQLSVDVQPAQSGVFSLKVETQRGLSALPADLSLTSMSVAGDAGETNMIGLAFGHEAQPGKITTSDLSVVNVDDFDRALIPVVGKTKGRGQARAILHKVYRSASGKGELKLQVAPVMPEVRVVSSQELSLGSERILLSSVIKANITRAGIFKLSFDVPEGLEVESLTGPSLSHWTENMSVAAKGDVKKRVVTMHLNGRTLGVQQFALSLTGQPAGAQGEWFVPKLLFNEAVRHSGQLVVIPEKGIRVRAIKRNNISRLNAQASQAINARVKQSGGLAFRILQSDWSLSLGIEKLESWITASVLQEVTLREGQTRTRISASYQIEHAAVKSIQVSLPGLSEDEARTVRASGSAVKGIEQLAGDKGVWQVNFRRGMLGSVPLQIEFQRSADRQQGGSEVISPAGFLATKRMTYFMAVRTTGRLDMHAEPLGRGWRRADWAVVERGLLNPADTSVPDICYRLSEPEGQLKVSLKRHQMADTLKLRVTGGNMMTVFAPGGESLTSVSLSARVIGKSKLRVTLPKEAQLYNVLVNDASVAIVREGDGHLFHVSAQSSDSDVAQISLVYSTLSDAKDVQLVAPSFSVPLEALQWDVLVPEGYRLNGYAGGFEMRGSQGLKNFTLKDYLAEINRKRDEEAQQGVLSLQKAGDYMRAGKRKEAAKELEKVTKNRSVDAASNEDARVQLFQLQCQEATWGLNTRRQRIYLDNKAAGNNDLYNAALEDSAYKNPLFQGKQEFDVRQIDDFLRGNSIEEKKTLKNTAKRMISQQLATERAPQTIRTIVRGRGEVLRFNRGILVDGDAEQLGLELDIESTTGVKPFRCTVMLLLMGLLGGLVLRRS